MNENLLKYIKLTRIDRPIGIYLLVLPCFFGIFFAFAGRVSLNWGEILRFCLIFSIGSIVMRSAGCVINDIFDRKIDAKVARTKNRPLASGDLEVKQAFMLACGLLFVSLIVLLQFSYLTRIAGAFALILVLLYPLMKRITFYPQIFLGVVFNFGVLMANLEIEGKIDAATLLLYVACIIWTLIYDTIYGFQDIEDDVKIGVKSSSIVFANNPRQKLLVLAGFMIFLLVLAGFMQKMALSYYFFLILAAFFQFSLLRECDFKDPKDCLLAFKKNAWFGVLLLAAIFFG